MRIIWLAVFGLWSYYLATIFHETLSVSANKNNLGYVAALITASVPLFTLTISCWCQPKSMLFRRMNKFAMLFLMASNFAQGEQAVKNVL